MTNSDSGLTFYLNFNVLMYPSQLPLLLKLVTGWKTLTTTCSVFVNISDIKLKFSLWKLNCSDENYFALFMLKFHVAAVFDACYKYFYSILCMLDLNVIMLVLIFLTQIHSIIGIFWQYFLWSNHFKSV